MTPEPTLFASPSRNIGGEPRGAGVKLRLRRGLHALLRAALRLRSQPYRPAAGPDPVTLVIAPHPDDDVLGCGGLVARKRLDGLRIHVVYLTDGGASHCGHPGLTPANLVPQRQAEARSGLRVLGVDSAETTFLGVADGTLDHLAPAAAAALVTRLAELLDGVRPDEILLPCRRDGSSEHEAAFRLVRRAADATGRRFRWLEYPVWAWWSPRLLARVLLTSRRVWRREFAGYVPVKREALTRHRSQLEPTPPWTRPVLSPAFVAFFLQPVEYFFES